MGLAASVIAAELLYFDEQGVELRTRRTDKLDALELQESGYFNDWTTIADTDGDENPINDISLLDALRSLACLGDYSNTVANQLEKKSLYRLGLANASSKAPFDSEGELKKRFFILAENWRTETMFTSSLTERVLNPSYQQIIGIGPVAIPLILQELQREPDQWFWALQSITGEQPAKPDIEGDICALADAWIAWGKGNGFI
jgi:hypothetical protein